MSTLLEKIKQVDNKELKPVEVPEWNLTVYIKQLSVGERDSYEAEVYNATKTNKMMEDPRSKFLARCLCDENGRPLVKPNEYKELAGLSSKPMERLFEECQRHNKLTDADVEELTKN